VIFRKNAKKWCVDNNILTIVEMEMSQSNQYDVVPDVSSRDNNYGIVPAVSSMAYGESSFSAME
jgi:hypothetical protein